MDFEGLFARGRHHRPICSDGSSPVTPLLLIFRAHASGVRPEGACSLFNICLSHVTGDELTLAIVSEDRIQRLSFCDGQSGYLRMSFSKALLASSPQEGSSRKGSKQTARLMLYQRRRRQCRVRCLNGAVSSGERHGNAGLRAFDLFMHKIDVGG